MTEAPEEIAVRALYGEMHRIRSRVPTSRWYVFGSITKTKRPVGDIDLLVVCETTAACRLVRIELALICARYPIHLLLMTTSEEMEVNFIKGESAVEITSGKSIPTVHGTYVAHDPV
ncbi:MAG TPA: hypothetical protein VMU78_06185 [Methylocella sp.]|nr:hypothetical protein [Methylocella sp.]